MNYSLANELKDAGFPQEDREKYWVKTASNKTEVYPDIFEQRTGHSVMKYVAMGEAFALPTLSELIEACGDRFFSLMRTDNRNWSATDNHSYRYDYSTPEEAVARLWLALNPNT